MNELVVDNRALAKASSQAMESGVPLVVIFVLSPQDYIAHDRSKRRIDFTLRNLSTIRVSLDRIQAPPSVHVSLVFAFIASYPALYSLTHAEADAS